MGEYGVHPTRYGEVSDGHLYSMFRESAYARLSESEKLDLLQEVVNRDAMEKGEIGAPEVRFAELPVNESGNAADGVIQVNRDMAVSGVQTFEYKGQTVQHRMDDYNCQTLNTILHENMHCFQDQIIDGTIQIDDLQLTSEYQANSYTNSIVWEGSVGKPVYDGGNSKWILHVLFSGHREGCVPYSGRKDSIYSAGAVRQIWNRGVFRGIYKVDGRNGISGDGTKGNFGISEPQF